MPPHCFPPQYQLNRLQAVMNSAERLICGLNKFDRVSRVLRDRLHWLPVPQWIQYKLCLLVYKSLRGLAPRYLADFCQPLSSVSARSGLRSSICGDLVDCDGFWTTLFCHVCTTGMPPEIRNSQSLESFNSRLGIPPRGSPNPGGPGTPDIFKPRTPGFLGLQTP